MEDIRERAPFSAATDVVPVLSGDPVDALLAAAARVSQRDIRRSLVQLIECLPVPTNVETATLWLRDSDKNRHLHAVAACGLPSFDLRRLAVEPMPLPRARALLALTSRHRDAQALGLRWLRGYWIRGESGLLGLLTLGSRTARRPGEPQLALLEMIVEELSLHLHEVDRREETLQRLSYEILRAAAVEAAPLPDSPLASLRPRERVILDLYADGLTTAEIARVLVLSPHTVRTHAKRLLKALGVHSRMDAIALAHTERATSFI